MRNLITIQGLLHAAKQEAMGGAMATAPITEADRLRQRIAELEEAAKTGPRIAEPENVQMDLKGNILTITIDMSKDFGKSASGKTITVASTRGNKRFDVGGKAIFVGVNAYTK